ncbi:MAG: thiamine pyrophosphate-binding protein [Gammaproteobacteria bacterium]|nr:MAG: thiamine pyrophosphate-binding protein [Gammaproteobacteria bacterium]
MKFQDLVARPVAVKSLSQIKVLEYGDLLVSVLNEYGVKFVFGIPGGGIEPLYNAMARSEKKGGLRPVVSRHESGAAFMADGYARESGKLGVCCTTTGPGATNILTGVASAYVDETPMLVLTGQTRQTSFGRGAAQDSSCDGVDIVAMFKHCTQYNTFVSHPDQLKEKLMKAISIATGSRPGPCHLSLPLDLLSSPANDGDFDGRLAPLSFRAPVPEPNVMNTLIRNVRKAKKGVLVLGPGAEGATNEIIQFAEQLDWPVITTPMGKGLVSCDHPLYFGVFGLAGHQSASKVLADDAIDTVIVIGSVLDEPETQSWSAQGLLTNKLIHIDSNELHFCRSTMAKQHVCGSPKFIFQAMIKRLSKGAGIPSLKNLGVNANVEYVNDPFQSVSGDVRIPPQRLFSELSLKAPKDTRVVVDIGNSFLWGIHYWQCRHDHALSKNIFRMGLGFGSMGWGIGAAIGTAMAEPNAPIICFTGDGSLLMNGQEISTAAQERLNVLFVVLNDQCLGTVKHGQRLAHAEETSFELPDVDFAMLARACGVESRSIASVSELMDVDVVEIFEAPGPYLLEVLIDAEQVPPMGARMSAINNDR